MIAHECVVAYGIDGELLAVSSTDTGLAMEILKRLGQRLDNLIRAGEVSVHRVTLEIPALFAPGSAVPR